MAKRKSSRKMTRRRSRASGLNVVNAAQSLIIANATTKALFGVGAVQFATQGWLTPKTTGAMGGAGNSWTLSATELFQGLTGAGFSQSGTAPWTDDVDGVKNAITHNLRKNGGQAIAAMIFVPAAFKLGKKLTTAPRRDLNRILKSTGLSSVVKV